MRAVAISASAAAGPVRERSAKRSVDLAAEPPVTCPLAADGACQALWIVDADPQGGMVLESDDLRDLLVELDAQTGVVIGTEGQAIVGEAQPKTDGRVPAVRPGDERLINVVERGFHAHAPEGCQKATVIGDVHGVIFTHAQRHEEGLPPIVQPVAESVIG